MTFTRLPKRRLSLRVVLSQFTAKVKCTQKWSNTDHRSSFMAGGQCGISKYGFAGKKKLSPPGQRIVGGSETAFHEFPWHVSAL